MSTLFSVPAVPNAPGVYGIDEDSVNVTFNPGNGEGGFLERFLVMYKEKGTLRYQRNLRLRKKIQTKQNKKPKKPSLILYKPVP